MSYRSSGPGRRGATLLIPAALILAAVTVSAPAARADNVTISSNNLRTAWDQNESALAPSSVAASDFGQLFSTALDGQVYAQPIVGNGTLFAATENNNVYGMNPSTGAIIWSKSIGAPWPAATANCADLVPNIGVTATPVYDSSTGTVYLTAKVNDGVDAAHPHGTCTPSTSKPGWSGRDGR